MDWMLFTGFCSIIFVIFFCKSIAVYRIYHDTFYEHIYSNFLEFYIKFKYKKNLSQSGWLKQEIGTHRILFNSYLNNKKEVQDQFVTIFSQYGIHIFSICTINGTVFGTHPDTHWVCTNHGTTTRFYNPSAACDNQIKHIRECIPDSFPVKISILFPKDTNTFKLKSKYPLLNFTNFLEIITESNPLVSEDAILNSFNNSLERNKQNV